MAEQSVAEKKVTWEIECSGPMYRVFAGPERTLASEVCCIFDSSANAEANAPLIAASPELLESCKALLDVLAGLMRACDTNETTEAAIQQWVSALEMRFGNGYGVHAGFGVRANAAIAKAEGRS